MTSPLSPDSRQPKRRSNGAAPSNRVSPLNFRVEHDGSRACVELIGDLVLSCEALFTDTVGMIEADSVVLDLRGLNFIDSSGLRMIIQTWERSRSEGFDLEIVRGSEHVDKLFRITGLDSRLPMVESASTNGHSPSL